MRIELKGCVGLPDCWMMHSYSLSFFVTRYICTQYRTCMWLPSSQIIIFCPKNWSFWHIFFGLSVSSWWSECIHTPLLPPPNHIEMVKFCWQLVVTNPTPSFCLSKSNQRIVIHHVYRNTCSKHCYVVVFVWN